MAAAVFGGVWIGDWFYRVFHVGQTLGRGAIGLHDAVVSLGGLEHFYGVGGLPVERGCGVGHGVDFGRQFFDVL